MSGAPVPAPAPELYQQRVPRIGGEAVVVEWCDVGAIAIDETWCAHRALDYEHRAVVAHRLTGLALGSWRCSVRRLAEAAACTPPAVKMPNVRVSETGDTGRLSKDARAALRKWKDRITESLTDDSDLTDDSEVEA